HPVGVIGGVLAVLLPGVHDDLGVRGRSEPVAAALEVRAQRGESVDLAVEGDVHRAVLVADGLIAGDEVDHAQPRDADRGGTVDVIAEGVGAAVRERAHHALEHRAVGANAGWRHEAGDATHGSVLLGRRRRRDDAAVGRQREEADADPGGLADAAHDAERHARGAAETERREDRHVAALERADAGRHHERGEAYRGAEGLDEERGREADVHAEQLQGHPHLERAPEPAEEVEEDGERQPYGLGAIEDGERVVQASEAAGQFFQKRKPAQGSAAAASRPPTWTATKPPTARTSTRRSQNITRSSGESCGSSAHAQGRPTTSRRPWAMVMVVLATITEGSASWRGTWCRISQALTASPPTDAVGVVRLNASPAILAVNRAQ